MWTLWRESKAQSLGNAPRLSRKHAIENYPNKPQRREGRSTAKPQPKPRNTRNTRKWDPIHSVFRVFRVFRGSFRLGSYSQAAIKLVYCSAEADPSRPPDHSTER